MQLYISKLHLKNFKRHQDLTCSFGKGFNVITGGNYQGKSTTLQGILFAMFGSSAVPGGAEVIKHNGEHNPKVTLDLTDGTDIYQITRTLNGATLFKNGESVAKGTTVVTQDVEKLTGLSKKYFQRLKYSRQSETAALVDMSTTELSTTVETLSGVSLINQVIVKAKENVKNIQAKIEGIGETMVSDTQAETAREELDQIKFTLPNHKTDLKEVKEQVKITLDLTASRRELWVTEVEKERTYKSQQDNINIWTNELEESVKVVAYVHAEAKQHKITLDYEFAQMCEKRQEELTSYIEETVAYDVKLESLVKEEARHKEYVSSLGEKVSEHIALLNDGIEDDTLAAQEDYDKFNTKLLQMEQNIIHANNLITKSFCSACGRTYDVDEEELANLKEQAAAMTERYKTRQTQLRQKSVHLMECKKKGVDNLVHKSDIQTLDKAINLERTALEKAQEQLKEMGDNEPEQRVISEIKEQLVEFKEMERKTRQMLDALSAEAYKNKILKQKLEECEELAPGDPAKAEMEMNESVQTLLDLEGRKSSLTEKVYAAQHRHDELNLSLKEHDRICKAIADYTQESTLWAGLSKLLSKNRDVFIQEIWDKLFNYTSEFLTLCTSGDVTRVSLDAKGNFQYEENGTTKSIHSASGSQRSLIGLGLKLSLSTLLPSQFSCLLLDEISADMDDEISAATVLALKTHYPQCISVTHRRLDESVSDHVINL